MSHVVRYCGKDLFANPVLRAASQNGPPTLPTKLHTQQAETSLQRAEGGTAPMPQTERTEHGGGQKTLQHDVHKVRHLEVMERQTLGISSDVLAVAPKLQVGILCRV